MSEKPTRPTMTRDEVMIVLNNLMSSVGFTDEYGRSLTAEEAYREAWGDDPNPLYRPDDPLFDPEAEGWEPRKTGTGGGTYYDEPRPGCLTFVTIPSTGLAALLDLSDGITLYHGKHPTRSLVMAIIEQNGGDA